MSKLDRWKKISSTVAPSEEGNPSKSALVDSLARMPESTEDDTTNKNKNNNHDSDVESMTTKSNHKKEVELQSINTTSTDDLDVEDGPSEEQGSSSSQETGEVMVYEASSNFVSKINNDIRNFKDNKTTKEDTHSRTSFQIRNDLLLKLRNFDKFHGGRIQGEFLNNLLEDYFDVLEQDPRWKKILNKKR